MKLKTLHQSWIYSSIFEQLKLYNYAILYLRSVLFLYSFNLYFLIYIIKIYNGSLTPHKFYTMRKYDKTLVAHPLRMNGIER